MGKYGKRNKVSHNMTDYNICLLGVPGIGKTTIMFEMCEKLAPDGYIFFNMGKEDGQACIDGIIGEDIENWKKFDEVTKDIIKNKKTDYPDLKIVVIDTIDQLFDLAEAEVIRQYNIEKMGDKNFKQINTINAAYGGYGAGLDRTIKIVLDKIWDLKKAGVAVWMCGHTKTKDIPDPVTDKEYSTISSSLSQKYFNAINTKMHVTGMAVIDRSIVTESTGRKDIHNKDITRNRIVSEARKIVFRDDNYGVDSKSRFRFIVDEIPLDCDAFIKAVNDAIEAAIKNGFKVSPDLDKPVEPKKVETTMETSDDDDLFGTKTEETEPVVKEEPESDDLFEETVSEKTDDELRKEAKDLFKNSENADLKTKAKKIIASYGKMSDVDRAGLVEIIALFK